MANYVTIYDILTRCWCVWICKIIICKLLDIRDLDELDVDVYEYAELSYACRTIRPKRSRWTRSAKLFYFIYDITHCHIIQSQSYHLLNSNDFLNKDHPIDHKRTYSLFALQQHLRSQKI